MATITANAILSKVKILIQDTTNIRWADSELLGWLNDGQREICAVRPDACTKVANLSLTAGTKQSIPADGTAIIKVIRNMGAAGSTAGQAIRKVPMELMDSATPGWHAGAANAVIRHYMADPRMPRNFYVYPPAATPTYVEILYGSVPTDVALVSDVISIDDSYANPLIDFIAFRAYAKDNDLIGNADRAAMHRKLYNDYMESRAKVDASVNVSKDNVKG